MFNALALWVLASWIFYEAYRRLGEHADGHGHEVEGVLMLAVASAGLVINILAVGVLYRSSRHSINVEGSFWHIMADLMGSIAVVISGVLTLAFDWDLVDPILSIIIAALILVSSCRLATKVFRVLLESVPAGLDMYRLCSALEEVEGVTLVHDVHAWTITSGYDALTATCWLTPITKGTLNRFCVVCGESPTRNLASAISPYKWSSRWRIVPKTTTWDTWKPVHALRHDKLGRWIRLTAQEAGNEI